MSTEVVIGGLAAEYLTEEDIHKIMDMELQGSNIAETLPKIWISEYNNTSAGAALIYIKEFLAEFGITGRYESVKDSPKVWLVLKKRFDELVTEYT